MKAIDNLINGNIAEAKKSAKHRAFYQIYDAARNDYGMRIENASATTQFLKGKIPWQLYCDLTKK